MITKDQIANTEYIILDLVMRRLVHFSLSLVAPGIIPKPFKAFKRINF